MFFSTDWKWMNRLIRELFSSWTYFECSVLYKRMPSASPQICTKSSFDIRNKSAPENWANVGTYWPRRCIFSHWAKINGVASLEMFNGVVMKPPFELLYSSLSTIAGVGGDRIFWSITLTLEFVDETLLMPIGFAAPLLLPAENKPSNLVMWIGEFDINGEPEPRILRI